MTFLEAAIAILEREGKPLHFKQLTEIALRQNMLTVVGRTPELTMQQRLNDALKKSDPALVLTREKPGVFGLRFYPAAPAPKAQATHAARPEQKVEAVVAPAPATRVPVETATPAAAAASAPEAAGEVKASRGRRRGGRGRGGSGKASAVEAADDLSAKDQAASAGSERSAESHAPDAAAAVDATPVAPPAPVEVARPVAATVPSAMPVPPAPAPGRPARTPVAPERRSFAEAAAVVAAGHRKRPDDAARGEAAPIAARSTESAVARASAPEAASVTAPLSVPANPRQTHPVAAEVGTEDAFEEPSSFDEDDLEAPSGPLIAPSHGTEEIVRGEDHRNVIEGEGRRRRGKDRQHGGRQFPPSSKPQDRPRQQAPQFPQRGKPAGAHPSTHAPAHHAAPTPVEGRDVARPALVPSAAPSAAIAEVRGGEISAIDAVIEILRSQEGRNVHVRQIVEMALKRKLLRGDSAELVRVVRAAILADAREREAVGLRVRVRATGGMSYVLDRRLENELYQLEREISDRVTRLGDLTRVVLHRRVCHLAAAPFEALMRVLMGRMGIAGVELVKRGDGVAYFGGDRKIAGGRRKVLVAVRPGEAEVSRRAVGELRAGLKARGYEEGILLSAGRAGADAVEEMAENGGAVSMHDGEELALLCARNGVGTMRRTFSIDVLDVDLLAEIQEA